MSCLTYNDQVEIKKTGASLKSLFVSNNKEEWDLLKKIFISHFSKIELMCVPSGAEALEFLSFEGPFGLILIDAALKNEDPMMLADNIVENSGDRPIIFIGDEAVLKSRIKGDNYLESETMDVFEKPYDIVRFKECIQKSLNWVKKEEFEQSVIEVERTNFMPIKLRNLYLFEKIPFDCFIELTRTKYIKAFGKDVPYSQAAVQDLGKRNIKVLYLKKDEHLQFLENSLKRIMTNLTKETPPQKMLENQISGALILQQFVKEVGVNDSIIELADKVITTVHENSLQYSEFTNFVLNYPLKHRDSAERSILIFYTCEAICRGLGWSSDLSRKKLGLASLIHDVHLEQEDMLRLTSFDHPDMELYSEEERESYKEHPRRAAAIANFFSGYSDTEFIIEQHHELPDGTGFPAKLNSNKLTTVSCVFIIAHYFVNQLTSSKLNASSVVRIVNEMKAPFNLGSFKEPMQILIRAIKG